MKHRLVLDLGGCFDCTSTASIVCVFYIIPVSGLHKSYVQVPSQITRTPLIKLAPQGKLLINHLCLE